MIGLWALVSALTALTIPTISILIVPCIFAVIWTIVSYPRIAATRLWWLHIAPYVTIAGAYDLLWALIEGANNGPWVIGFKPWPWWEQPLQLAGIPAALAWPSATLALILFRAKQAA